LPQRRHLEIADEFLHSVERNLRDTRATDNVVVEILSRLEERAGEGTPVAPGSDQWVIKSETVVVGNETVEAIRVVYVLDGLDVVIAVDASYCDQPFPVIDDVVTLPIIDN
jgi:hypothetical protein